MADREFIAKIVNMLGADEMTALVAVRKLQKIAAEEKKLMSELLMVGPVVYQDRIVYRDPVPPRGPAREDIREEVRRQKRDADARQAARARQRYERAQAERESAQKKYGSAFDDVEPDTGEAQGTAEERGPKRDHFRGKRVLLDELTWALAHAEQGDLTFWEIEFAESVPNQVAYDWELTDRQTTVLRRIVAKIKRKFGESPI